MKNKINQMKNQKNYDLKSYLDPLNTKFKINNA